MNAVTTEDLVGKCAAFKSIAEGLAAVPPNCISADTLAEFDRTALNLLNLIDVE